MSASEPWPSSASERKIDTTSDRKDPDPADRGLCPLRRLREEEPSDVLSEFAQRVKQMPPEHNLLMTKFQENEELRKELDAKFGDDKELLLAYLFETHKKFFQQGSRSERSSERLQLWLEGVNQSEDEAVPKKSSLQKLQASSSSLVPALSNSAHNTVGDCSARASASSSPTALTSMLET